MKGVSPVIATVLMVAVAIAAAVVLYSWIMSTTSTETTQASAQAGTIGKYMFTIESAKCSPGSGNTIDLNLEIRNSSDVEVNGDFVYTVYYAGKTEATGKETWDFPAKTVTPETITVTTSPDNVKDKQISIVINGPDGISMSYGPFLCPKS
jgi:flagellin-like protein